MSGTFGQCRLCPKTKNSQKLYGDGVCHYHIKNAVDPAVRKLLAEENKEIAAQLPAMDEKKQLNEWFAARRLERPKICEEPGCSTRLLQLPGWQVKATIAHIVPKRHFKSVQTHPLNRLFLCKTPHHDDYDSSWDRATKMAIWPMAVERFQVFMHLITDKELRFLPDALRELTNR